MNFRVALLRVSDQLTNQQLDNLKFLSRSVLTNSRIDRIRIPLDLFAALEERGKLSSDNTSFLHRMLESAGYNEARRELDLAGFTRQQSPDVDQTFLFYECLLKVATELESTQFDNIKFFFKDRLKQNIQKIFLATDLFQLLIQRQIIKSNDLKALHEALHQVGCVYLCNRVVEPYMLQQIGGQQPHMGGGAVPNTLFSGAQSQFRQPVEEQTPVTNNPNPLRPHVERFSSSSTLSPMSPPGRAESAASTLSSIEGEPSLAAPRPGSMASHPSMDSSQQPVHIDSQGRLYNVAAHGVKQERNDSVQNMPTQYGGVHPMSQCSEAGHGVHPVSQPSFHSQSQQPNVERRVQHPTSQPSPPSVGRHSNGQQYNPGVHYYSNESQPPQPQYGGPLHPVSQPSYPNQFSPSRPQFQIGGEHLYPQNLPPVAAVFEIDQQQQVSQNQQLQQELARKDAELRVKEDHIRAYQVELGGIQAHISSVSGQHQDREKEYKEKISNLESVLRQMTSEAEVQISEMQRLHQQLQVANPASPQDDEDYYKMSKSPHGICLIINNHEFYHSDPDKRHPTRNGAHVDVHNLTQTFKYLRYKVETKENLSSHEMRDALLGMANRDHSQYDSFICCILTHGEQGVVHGSDCEPVNLNDLAGVTKMCSSLHGKPKLFFIQACRGDNETKGFELPERDAGGGPYHNTIPQESDFYFGFATPTGSSAYRSRRYGSWFISEVCQVFIKHSYTHDLGAMMVKVNKRVSDAYTKDGFKQSPESVNRLRFQVHFFRFIKGINGGR